MAGLGGERKSGKKTNTRETPGKHQANGLGQRRRKIWTMGERQKRGYFMGTSPFKTGVLWLRSDLYRRVKAGDEMWRKSFKSNKVENKMERKLGVVSERSVLNLRNVCMSGHDCFVCTCQCQHWQERQVGVQNGKVDKSIACGWYLDPGRKFCFCFT